MKKLCPVCSRKISININSKICRHGFKRNRWIFVSTPEIPGVTNCVKVDGTPCRGSGKIGLKIGRKNVRNK